MAKWSVALFGHYKPRFYMNEREYKVTVATFRDAPEWDEENQMWRDGLIEFPIKVYRLDEDLNEQKRAQPGDIIAWKPWTPDIYWSPTERKEFLIITIDGPSLFQMDALCEEYWDTTTWKEIDPDNIDEAVELSHPKEHLKKRRFHFPLNDLVILGVDQDKMLDKNIEYVPVIKDILKTEAYDKMNDRYVTEQDELKLIEPVIINPSIKAIG